MDTKEQIRKLVTKLHKESGVCVEPTYPRVLIRVLPKEQVTSSGLYLPDSNQNKTTYEGVVLKTYPKRLHKLEDGSDYWEDSCVQVGDHVLFPYYEGIPIMRLDKGVGDYRLIPDTTFIAVLRYDQGTAEEWLRDLFYKNGCFDDLGIRLINAIISSADVIRRDQVSKTISGK
jgi:co-chaperonin GroES (HSP10)